MNKQESMGLLWNLEIVMYRLWVCGGEIVGTLLQLQTQNYYEFPKLLSILVHSFQANSLQSVVVKIE